MSSRSKRSVYIPSLRTEKQKRADKKNQQKDKQQRADVARKWIEGSLDFKSPEQLLDSFDWKGLLGLETPFFSQMQMKISFVGSEQGKGDDPRRISDEYHLEIRVSQEVIECLFSEIPELNNTPDCGDHRLRLSLLYSSHFDESKKNRHTDCLYTELIATFPIVPPRLCTNTENRRLSIVFISSVRQNVNDLGGSFEREYRKLRALSASGGVRALLEGRVVSW